MMEVMRRALKLTNLSLVWARRCNTTRKKGVSVVRKLYQCSTPVESAVACLPTRRKYKLSP